ncbi:hypothetical protein L9F63_024903, partial [Diploptera punctata]
ENVNAIGLSNILCFATNGSFMHNYQIKKITCYIQYFFYHRLEMMQLKCIVQ